MNKEFMGVLKLNLYKEYITLANSKCFTIRQLLWGRWCLSPVFNVSVKHLFRRNIGALCTTAHPIQAGAAAVGKTFGIARAT